MPSVPSTQRPIPLAARADLRSEPIEFQGTTWWVVKDPVSLQYQRLRDEQYRALRLLDGRRSLDDLREALRRECPTVRFTHTDLQQLVTDLHLKGLVRSNRLGQGAVLRHEARRERLTRWKQALLNPLSIQLPGIDPQRALDRLLPVAGWLFHPAAMIAAVFAVATALGWLAVHVDAFRQRLPEFSQFFGWPNVVWLWVTLCATKILHEFGHGLACRRYGAECHQMGVMLLVFSPCLYCDATDSWMLPNKWKRIAIGAAGMYVEAILSAIAIALWWNTSDGLLNHLCLNVFFVSTVTTVIFNINPLMRFDGYYMLSDFLEIPNLRPQAEQMLRNQFGAWCLGIEPKPDPFAPDRGRGWFIAFAVAAWCYRWVVLFGITYFLCTVLKPYGLQSVGVTAAALSMSAMLSSLVLSMYRLISAPREEPMSRTRMGISVGVLAGLIVAALFVPLPLFVDAPFFVEPQHVQHVYVAVPGVLLEVSVKPGDRVARGAVLAVLSNPEKEDRRRELLVEIAAQEQDRKLHRALGDSGQRALAEARLRTLAEQLAELEVELQKLTIVAPMNGAVVAPERTPEPKLDADRARLSAWFGRPLDAVNRGCFLEARTHLLSIAPNDRFDAVLLVDQSDRDAVHVGRTISLKLEHAPHVTYAGTIRELSQREEQFAPPGLSMKQGGGLPTVADAEGRERLTSAVYQAIVPLDSPPAFVRTGERGKARMVHPRSAGEWLWRTLRQTLHFRL